MRYNSPGRIDRKRSVFVVQGFVEVFSKASVRRTDVLERALDRHPEFIFSKLPLMAAYAHLGREQKAKAVFEEWKEAIPTTHVQGIAPHWPFKYPSDAERLLDGLRKAGVPEKRPVS